jgi:hypothetical protein
MKDGLITLQLGGKERTLKFNMRALETLSEVKLAGDIGLSSAAVIVYAGLIGWHYAKQTQPDFTFEDVSEWVEDIMLSEDRGVIADVNECFESSRAFKFIQENAKKKVAQLTGQTSTLSPGEQSGSNPENTTS